MDKEFLNEVEGGKEFYLKNGRIIRSLEELAREIKELDMETFLEHVNEERNDFENWVRDVIGDVVLAKRLEKVKRQTTIGKIISGRVVELSFL